MCKRKVLPPCVLDIVGQDSRGTNNVFNSKQLLRFLENKMIGRSSRKNALLNLVMKGQFSGAGDDAALHLNNFVELSDMQKYKEVDGDILKLKLFSFSLRGRDKEWLQFLPRNSINSWDKCKDAFIGKYYPPAKIIQLRSNIMNFRQLYN